MDLFFPISSAPNLSSIKDTVFLFSLFRTLVSFPSFLPSFPPFLSFFQQRLFRELIFRQPLLFINSGKQHKPPTSWEEKDTPTALFEIWRGKNKCGVKI
jgi:hypothetical protein